MNMAAAVRPEEIVLEEAIMCPVDMARAFIDVIKVRASEGVSIDRQVLRAESGRIQAIELSASTYDAENHRRDIFHTISIGRESADEMISAAINAAKADPDFENVNGVNTIGCNLTMALVDLRLGRG